MRQKAVSPPINPTRSAKSSGEAHAARQRQSQELWKGAYALSPAVTWPSKNVITVSETSRMTCLRAARLPQQERLRTPGPMRPGHDGDAHGHEGQRQALAHGQPIGAE